ncbi:glycosyl transferase family 2 [Motilibacter peucedani]|uniref:Glycosyl transferase family 2 n=1 Tax=Motilibacter peucedani TaxID=598650 RepID=A0A420XU06_9ACTN|nr:glycosyltransferase family A protein [Motilibacter peucedani]RKS80304.1 glycosyl transferase family 2 [Motilibacter peucedani]
MPTPTVGVVIPTYERVDETERAVRSVLEQTRPADQVVVVDDGSSSATVEALEIRLAGLATLVKAPRTALPGRSRNAGVAVLDTDWVAFLDSDDTWAPERLERQLQQAARTGAVALCSNADRVVDGQVAGRVLDGLPATLALADLVKVNSVINSTVLLRRDVLLSVGGVAASYSVRGCEDYATWLRVATSHDWSGIDEPLVRYTDEPSTSIRGAEEFAVHPGQQAAWLDFVLWRREAGRPLELAEQALGRGVRAALLAETSERGARAVARALSSGRRLKALGGTALRARPGSR